MTEQSVSLWGDSRRCFRLYQVSISSYRPMCMCVVSVVLSNLCVTSIHSIEWFTISIFRVHVFMFFFSLSIMMLLMI